MFGPLFYPIYTMENCKKIKNPWIGKPGYNCVGCSPDNPVGLHMEFYAGENETVLSEWNPADCYQGWIGVLHGGIQALMIDEAAGWWIFYYRCVAGVTVKMDIKYHKVINISDGPVKIKVSHVKDVRNFVYMKVELSNAAGELCSSSDIVYFLQSKEYSEEVYQFHGCETE